MKVKWKGKVLLKKNVCVGCGKRGLLQNYILALMKRRLMTIRKYYVIVAKNVPNHVKIAFKK